MSRRFISVVSVLGALTLVALLVPAAQVGASTRSGPPVRIRYLPPDYRPSRLDFHSGGFSARRLSATSNRIGATRTWLALDDIQGSVYFKKYKLRGKGKHIEVWVANDSDDVSTGLRFPEGDCRNDERVRITNKQVNYLIKQFDNNMYPKETKLFSRPPSRDGSSAALYNPSVVDPPFKKGYFKGEGGRIVTLIDNVREDHFYDTNNSNNLPYIAGFFTSTFNELFDRNVMTIDAYDWLHRTGPNPPNEPSPGDNCESKPARPFQYESTFAHEYQHLLEYYRDSDETTWLNEGLSEVAMSVTGYSDTSAPITELGFDGHIQAFLGWLAVQTDANPNPRKGGPENSLNLWEEHQQPGEVLSDYGGTYSFNMFLKDRYGNGFIRKLHRANANGLESVDALLQDTESKKSARQVIHEWSAMVALDGVLDDGATLSGAAPATYRSKSLDASVNWDSVDTYSAPGAPPNGADFVRLRDNSGDFLNADDIDSITFDGGDTLPPEPVEWTVAQDPPGHPNNAALHSGAEPDLDRAIVTEVSVPTSDPTLTFQTRYELDDGFDFGFVQVSTDGGRTYRSLGNDDTTSDPDPGATDNVFDNVPGFTGNSGCPPGSQINDSCEPTWLAEEFDLSQYAGQDIVLAFRNITDRVVTLGGWWIDDVAVGNKKISQGSTVNDWQTPTEVSPIPVEGFTVQLIAYNDEHTEASYVQLALGGGFTGSLEGANLDTFLPAGAETVAAIVTYDDSTETSTEYAPYTLEVNGAKQPGGS